MQSDDDEGSSSSQSSRSGSSSPEAPTLTVAQQDGDDGSDSDSSLGKSSKTLSPKRDQDSEEESGSSDDDNAEKQPSSSTASSDNDDDDDRGRTSDQNENDASSQGSRSRSASASSGRSRSSEHSHSDREDVTSNSNTGTLKKLWERDPDFYGIRRSSRNRVGSRIKPPKLIAQVQKKPQHKKVQPKKRKLSSDAADSSDEEITRTVRKRQGAISYKEHDSEDEADEMSADENEADESHNGEPAEPEEHFETIERVMDLRDGKKGATGSITTIYAVEKTGDPNLTLPAETEIEKQFLIKWIGWSHLHNTWESIDTLSELKAKGLKKLDNYCKKEDELSRWRRIASPEDVEYFECQLELQQELAKCYLNVERIISENKTDDDQLEYYVKWDCLPYAEATWESGTLIKNRNPEAVEIFKKRESSHRTPSSSAKSLRSRPKFLQIKRQPHYMDGDSGNLVLRDYQLDGVNWLVHSWCKENSVILADEMGLGKTIQTICLLSYLFETHNLYGPYLIVVPLSTMAAWQREFAQWAPQINVVTYLGDISSRDIIREYEWFFKSNGRIKFNCILTTYEIVLKDKAFLASLSWAILMVDEAHRLKNGESLLYKSLQEFETYHRLLITGTPLQNSLKELWSLLHFIMPNKFDDWEYFEKEHDQAATKGYAKLHKQLEPYILRRVKKDVEKSLPAKVEQILRVEMTLLQKQYYKWILTKNYTALRKGIKGSVSSFINVVMELKKCCNHATLVKPIDNPSGDTVTQLIKGSGKLMLLDKLLVRLRETGHRVLIFSQMVRMLDIIAEYLQLRRFSFQRLDGSIKGDLRKQALDHFNAEGSSDFCFLLSTRAGGLGINLATADTVIIFDSDWNPQNDLQAQARAHRIGQKNQVNIYRLVTKNSVEEDIVERAKKKMVLDHLVIQRMDTTGRTVLDKGSKSGTPFNKDELTAILKFGAEELFKEDDNDGEDHCDIDEILRRAETHEDPGERPGDELLSAFKVASFSVAEEEEEQIAPSVPRDWEQIIPEDLRKQVEAEEKEREMAELFLPPRSSRTSGAAGRPLDNGQGTNTQEALKKVTRKRKRGEESDSDDDKKKKRGRPKTSHKEKGGVKGFTNAQIKRFIKSMKRFPKPLLRIETIAKDAELTDKSFVDLKKLGETLLKGCRNAMLEAKKNPALLNPVTVKEEPAAVDGEAGATPGVDPKKKREKGPMFIFAGTSINARTLSLALDELEPLGEAIPKDPEVRKNWKFELKAKVPQFDVEWGPEEDTQLLLAVWEYGVGGWDKIREATPLLKEKIFLEGEQKPLIKHVQARTDHLIKVIKKDLILKQRQNPAGKVRKKREKKEKLVDGVANGLTDVKTEVGVKEGGEAKERKPRVKKPKKAKNSGPMHITANSIPTPLNVLGGLEPSVFNECKEKMRPVKKALKSLDNPDTTISEKEQIRQTRIALLQIGDQIQTLLATYKDKDQMKQWKIHLWGFVSNFTEYDSNDLYKLYKKASKKEESKGDKDKGKSDKGKSKSDKSKSRSLKGKGGDDESKIQNGRLKSNSPKHDRDYDREKRRKESHRGKRRSSHESSSHPENDQDHAIPNKSSKAAYYDRERDDNRDRERERNFAYSGGENERISAAPPGGGTNFDSSSSYGTSQFSPQKYRNGPPYGGSGDYHQNNTHGSSYRERDTRERAPGDPRDRTGIHAGKNYYNNNSNFDRDRGAIPERGGGFTGRSWAGQKNRTWVSSNYPRRDDYYGTGPPASTVGPPPFSEGRGSRGGPGAGMGGYRGRGGALGSPYNANNASRIAPPLMENHPI